MSFLWNFCVCVSCKLNLFVSWFVPNVSHSAVFFSSLSLEKSVIPLALRSAATSLRNSAAFFQSEMMRPANDPKERDPAHVRMLNDVLRDLEKSFISSQSAPGVYRWEDVYSCDGVLLSSVVCLGLTLCNTSKYVIILLKESPLRAWQTQLTFWNLEGSKVKSSPSGGWNQQSLAKTNELERVFRVCGLFYLERIFSWSLNLSKPIRWFGGDLN